QVITSNPPAPTNFLRIWFLGRAQNAPKTAPATTDGVPIALAMAHGSVRIETSGYLCAPATPPATSRTLLKGLKDL
ncbi:hypothetical protein, partial [Synechococcus sp.]|uniref:hypothetical protein n=1 Tax=Synechococcus sp. TaxID=1131 RepID=UPI0034A2BC58